MGRFGKPKRVDLRKLDQFAAANEGVEAYLEPQTISFPQSLLLVARGGEWARCPVNDRGVAVSFCKKLGIPLYDAAVVGYPERMRGAKGAPAPDIPSADELESWFSERPE